MYRSVHGTMVRSTEHHIQQPRFVRVHIPLRCGRSALHHHHRPILPLFSSLFPVFLSRSTISSHIPTITIINQFLLRSLLRTPLMPPPDSYHSNHPIHLGAQPVHLVDHIRQFNHISTGLLRC